MQQCTKNCPSEYLVTDKDAVQYTRHCLVVAIGLYAAYFLSLTGLVSPLALFVVVVLVLPRWGMNVHELLHVRNVKQINWFIRLMGARSPLPISVLTISSEQWREIHYLHHFSPATEKDPDAYHTRGRFWIVFLNAFTTPEQNFIRWVAAKGINFQLCLDLIIKLFLLGILVWLGRWKFLWFWLSLRLVDGISDIVFFRLLHYRQGKYGTFQLHLPDILERLGRLIFGDIVMSAIIDHDVHHQNPRIATGYLASARAYIFD